MELNQMFERVGRPGAFNILLYSIAFSLNVFVAFHHVGMSSMYGISVPHRCKLPHTLLWMDNATEEMPDGNNSGNHKIYSALSCAVKITVNMSEERGIKCSSWNFAYPHGTLKSWVNEWNLVCDKSYVPSMSTALYMAGVMFGSPLTGMASDRYGRRKTLLICLAISTIVSISMTFIPNLILLIVMRTVLGFFISGVHGIAYIIPTEITAEKNMTFFSIVQMNGFIVGAFIGTCIAYATKYWRIAQVVLSAPGFLCFILVYLFLPELPRWCLAHKNYEGLQAFFLKAIKFNKISAKDLDDIQSNLLQDQINLDENREEKQQYGIADVFRTRKIRQRTLICMYLWFTSGISYYALLLNMKNISENPFLATLIAAATDMPTYFLAFVYIPRLGKRRSICMVMAVGGIFCLIYAFYNSLVILLIGKAFIASSLGMVFIYLPDIYPTVIRNIGVGTVSLCCRAGSILAPLLVLVGSLSKNVVPIIVVGCLAVIACVVGIFAPEVKGKKLPDTVQEVEKRRSAT